MSVEATHDASTNDAGYYIVKYDMSKELERCAFLVRSKLEIGSQIMNQPAWPPIDLHALLKSNKKQVAKLHVFRTPKNSHVADVARLPM